MNYIVINCGIQELGNKFFFVLKIANKIKQKEMRSFELLNYAHKLVKCENESWLVHNTKNDNIHIIEAAYKDNFMFFSLAICDSCINFNQSVLNNFEYKLNCLRMFLPQCQDEILRYHIHKIKENIRIACGFTSMNESIGNEYNLRIALYE